jgi:FAD/FMN-containing dehydrogenase
MFFNVPLAKLIKTIKEHVTAASPKTVVMFAVYTGKNGAPATPIDAAFSMTGQLYGGPWTQWDNPASDAENISWHENCMRLLQPYAAGHYIAETDIVEHPEFSALSYKQANWKRLADLRKKHDPEGLFFDFQVGLR